MRGRMPLATPLSSDSQRYLQALPEVTWMGVEWGEAKLLPVRNQCLISNVTPGSSGCPFLISLGSMPFSPFLPLQYRFSFF